MIETEQHAISRFNSTNEWLEICKDKHTLCLREIGSELRVLRESKGLSLRTMAKRMDISVTYFADMERGRRHFNTDTIKRFFKALTSNQQS